MRGVRRWLWILGPVVLIVFGLIIGWASRRTTGPYPPTLEGSTGGLKVWSWTDATVECMIFTNGGDVDSVCRNAQGLMTPTPKQAATPEAGFLDL